MSKTPRNQERRIHEYASKILAGFGIVFGILFALAHFGVIHIEGKHTELLIAVGVGLLSSFYLALVYGQAHIAKEIRQLRKLSKGPNSPEWRDAIKRSLPSTLHDIFESEIDGFCTGIERAQNQHEVCILDSQLSPRFYKGYQRTLSRFPGATIYATARADEKYWKVFGRDGGGILDTYDSFFRDGGRMERIFIVRDRENLSQRELKVVLKHVKLQERHVGKYLIYTASESLVREKFDSGKIPFFVVVCAKTNATPPIAWEVDVDGFKITQITATAFPDRCSGYLKAWQDIRRAAGDSVVERRTLIEKSMGGADGDPLDTATSPREGISSARVRGHGVSSGQS